MSDSESSSDGDYYGPALPPHLQGKSGVAVAAGPKENEDRQSTASSSSVSVSVVGPAIPPHLLKSKEKSEEKEKTTSPPASSSSSSCIGPALPPGFKLPSQDNDEEEDEGTSRYTGPGSYRTSSEYVGEDEDDDEDDEVIGPLPPDHPLAAMREASFASKKFKGRDDEDTRKLKREEWMLIPPKNKTVSELGLAPRKFLQRNPENPVKDDGEPLDSDEEFERQVKAEMDQKIIDDYDKKMEAMVDKDGKRKAETLLELHQKQLKKKAKKDKDKEEAKARRPFDRNVDLSVSGLSNEDKKKYVEKTKELGGRFKIGRQKFL